MKDYYKILELPFGASSPDIKRAYYRLAFKYHPDKNFGNPVFESIFKEINEAYLVLSSEKRRLIYHAEYNDFKNGITFRHEPFVTADPAFRPQPRGPATRVTFEYKELKITVAILFTVMVLYLLYESFGHMKEPPDTENILSKYDTSRVAHHLTKDEYYEIISREFIDSHDSTLMKLDVDSMVHVMDSMMNAGK